MDIKLLNKLKSKQVIITDELTKDLLDKNNIDAYVIPDYVIEDKEMHVYLNLMSKALKQKDKKRIFISMDQLHIEIFNHNDFKTIFLNCKTNDNYDIKATYEKRLSRNKKFSIH